jgi:DNA gyrase subunit A
MSLDPRVIGDFKPKREGEPAPVHAVAVTSDGYALRFGLDGLVEVSTRAGRRFARPADGAEVVGVDKVTGKETMIAATAEARGMLCPSRRSTTWRLRARGPSSSSCRRGQGAGFSLHGDRPLLTVETTAAPSSIRVSARRSLR